MRSRQSSSSPRGAQRGDRQDEDRNPAGPFKGTLRSTQDQPKALPHQATALHYVLAAALTLATLLLYLAFAPLFGNKPASTVFLIPVVLTAYLGGLGPGLVSTVLGLFAAWYVITPPFFSFRFAEPVDYVHLALTFFIGVLISGLSESLLRTREKAVGDIFQRKRAEKLLLDSEQRYSSLFENMQAGFAFCKMIFDEHGRAVDFVYLEVNPAFEKLTGLKNAAGKRVTELIPGISKAHPELIETYGRVALNRKPEQFEIEFMPLNSWFSVSVYSPEKEYFAIVFENITERKQATAQNVRLAAAVEQAAEGIVITDPKADIEYVNPAFTRMTGYGFAEAIGENPRILKSGRHDEKFYKEMRAAIYSGKIWHGELVNRRKDGSLYNEEMTIAPVRDPQGNISSFIAIKQDITERKQAEEQLKQQLILMKSITDKSTDSIFLTDSAGRVTFVNPEAERVFGYTAAEMKGQVLHDLIHHHHPDGRPFLASECPVLKTFQTGETMRNYEEVYFRKDGSMVDVIGSTALLESQEERLGIVYVLRDVTERKQEARAKLRSQKLEALGTIAGGIAHDFNNILAAINGNAQFALSELQAGRPVEDCLSEIAKAGARAADLVRRILSFASQGEQKKEVQLLQPVVEEAVKLVRATFSTMIEIRTDFAPNLPPVKIDSSQIHQILVNLATNSAHAIGDRPGLIEVHVESVDLHPEDIPFASNLNPGRYVRLYVRDDGCGIEPLILERIFDPFFTTKPAGQGTGLGLSVVHGIVSNHSGAIAVNSDPGKGTAFHIYFPAVERRVARVEPKADETQRPHCERVLYIDDEEALVFLLTKNLERLGCQVTGFTDPEAALREFRLRPDEFDVVVTDVSMPRMSGFDLARELQAIRANIPIVVTSGYLRPEDQAKAEKLGIEEVILKPSRVDDLARAFDRIFLGRATTANNSSS